MVTLGSTTGPTERLVWVPYATTILRNVKTDQTVDGKPFTGQDGSKTTRKVVTEKIEAVNHGIR